MEDYAASFCQACTPVGVVIRQANKGLRVPLLRADRQGKLRAGVPRLQHRHASAFPHLEEIVAIKIVSLDALKSKHLEELIF